MGDRQQTDPQMIDALKTLDSKHFVRQRNLINTFAGRIEQFAAQALRREGYKIQKGLLFRKKPLSEDASLKYEALAEARVVKGLLLSDDPEVLRKAAYKSFRLGRIAASARLGMNLFRDAMRGEKSRRDFEKSLATRRKNKELRREECRQIFKELFQKNPRLSRNALVDRTSKQFGHHPNGRSASAKSVERYTRDLGPSPRPKLR